MLISTVCKTHGLSRIRGPILFLRFLHLRPCYARLLRRYYNSRRVDSRGRSTRASGRIRIDRSIVLIFTSEPQWEERSPHPTLRSRSAGRSLESESLIRFSLCCERAGPSLVDHGVCVKTGRRVAAAPGGILYTNIIKFYHYNIGSFFLVKFMWHVYTHCHGK